jgi:sulfatase maturation enzyme AslB (radical SAM superfamily)
MKGPYAVLFNVTNYCNLNCDYCFLTPLSKFYEKKEKMDIDTAKRVTNEFIGSPDAANKPEIVFFGFEPLLNWSLIVEYVLWAKKEMKGNIGNISIYTNGTLLNNEKIEFLIKHSIEIKISIDSYYYENKKHRNTTKEQYNQLWKRTQKIININPNLIKISKVITKENLKNLEKSFKFINEIKPRGIILLADAREKFTIKDKATILKGIIALKSKNRSLEINLLPEFLGCCSNGSTTNIMVFPNGDLFDLCATCEQIYLKKKRIFEKTRKEEYTTFLGNINSKYSFSAKKSKKNICKCVDCPTISKRLGFLSRKYRKKFYK